MKDKLIYQIHADICKALTHPIRLEIIDCLRGGENNVTQLTEKIQAPQTTVSWHLRVMRIKGVVVQHNEGSNVYYQLGSPRISAAYDEIHQFAIEYLATQAQLLQD